MEKTDPQQPATVNGTDGKPVVNPAGLKAAGNGPPPNPPPDPPPDPPPIQKIYNQLNGLFGNGVDDVFQMEFPARLLEQGNYQYTGSDTINAQQVKPPAVAEAEFRLVDDLFDLSNLVGGSNGSKLSDKYREVLFSLLPFRDTGESTSANLLRTDQDKICDWLETPVDNFDPPIEDVLGDVPDIDGLKVKNPQKKAPHRVQGPNAGDNKPKKIPRVDLYQKLLDVYSGEKYRWEAWKNDNRPRNFSKQKEVDAYDRLLSTYAPVVDARLEAMWTVLLVRGQYHRVRNYVGYIDIETASERLQRAKQDLRASVTRSIDDTQDIYPVVLTPANWAKYLSTNFKPQDLLSDESTIRSSLFSAQKSRALLINRKNTILAGSQDIKKLDNDEKAARDALSKSRADLAKGLSDSSLTIVQLFFDAISKSSDKPAEVINAMGQDAAKDNTKVNNLNEALKKAGQPTLDPIVFKSLCQAQASCLENQASLSRASEAYMRAKLASEVAKADDGARLLSAVQDQIDSLTMDIQYYQNILAQSTNALDVDIQVDSQKKLEKNGQQGGKSPLDRVPTEPKLPTQDEGASVWQEVILGYTANKTTSTSIKTASVAHEDFATGLWFWSASTSQDTSEASSRATHSTSNTNIKIAFRAMKVEIQRPWMDGGLLGETANFYRESKTKISNGTPADIKAKMAAFTDVNAKTEILPSWPTGFVVAKDIHIIFTSDTAFDASYTDNIKKATSTGGGILWFSCSKNESSSESRESAVVTSTANTVSIRIPAPQIIGWISELAPNDASQTEYQAFKDDEFKEKPLPPSPPVPQPAT